MNSFSFQAPAKINLALEVVGKRDDGYHDLDMLNVLVDLYDDVTVTLGVANIPDTIKVDTDLADENHFDNDVFSTRNLALRAARLLLDFVEDKRSVHIKIYKRIPAGAGLGGGSSNAAVSFIAVNKMLTHSRQLSIDKLVQLSVELGSDIPYIIRGGFCRVRGKGEIIETLNAPFLQGIVCVLVLLREHMTTADVFRYYDDNIKLSDTENSTSTNVDVNIAPYVMKTNEMESYSQLIRRLRNDLETSVCLLSPRISHILALLRKSVSGYSAITGSGSTVFVLPVESRHFKSDALIREVKMALNTVKDSFQVYNARIIT